MENQRVIAFATHQSIKPSCAATDCIVACPTDYCIIIPITDEIIVSTTARYILEITNNIYIAARHSGNRLLRATAS